MSGGGVERVLATACLLGEGPVWDAQRACLWFVDIKRHRLHRFDPATGAHATLDAPEQIGWVAPATGGALLAGMKDGLYALDDADGAPRWRYLQPVPGEPVGNRLNDACVDGLGGVHFGSMDDGEEAPSGRFYRYAAGVIEPVGPDGVCITNGPAVSPASDRIYFTDTLGKTIHVASLDASGRPGAAELFADTARDFPDAYPDGPVCDALGRVWTGLWNGWGVACYALDGTLLHKVELPVANVTKVAFGGADLRRVFVTTASKGLDAGAKAAQPMAGDLFAFDSDVPGIARALVEI